MATFDSIELSFNGLLTSQSSTFLLKYLSVLILSLLFANCNRVPTLGATGMLLLTSALLSSPDMSLQSQMDIITGVVNAILGRTTPQPPPQPVEVVWPVWMQRLAFITSMDFAQLVNEKLVTPASVYAARLAQSEIGRYVTQHANIEEAPPIVQIPTCDVRCVLFEWAGRFAFVLVTLLVAYVAYLKVAAISDDKYAELRDQLQRLQISHVEGSPNAMQPQGARQAHEVQASQTDSVLNPRISQLQATLAEQQEQINRFQKILNDHNIHTDKADSSMKQLVQKLQTTVTSQQTKYEQLTKSLEEKATLAEHRMSFERLEKAVNDQIGDSTSLTLHNKQLVEQLRTTIEDQTGKHTELEQHLKYKTTEHQSSFKRLEKILNTRTSENASTISEIKQFVE